MVIFGTIYGRSLVMRLKQPARSFICKFKLDLGPKFVST